MVREIGLEPTRLLRRQDLNLLRLPISPLSHGIVRNRSERAQISYVDRNCPYRGHDDGIRNRSLLHGRDDGNRILRQGDGARNNSTRHRPPGPAVPRE